MMRIREFIRGLTIAGLSFLAPTMAAAGEARIAVASNFKPAMDALEKAFEEETGHALIVTSGATGKLYAQIINGAPFDIFMAADEARPRLLEENGLAVMGSRRTYALGRLVLWRPAGGPISADLLRQGRYRRLAIANPDLAPYGAAAMDTLSYLGAAQSAENKLVFGENIGQAFAFVQTGNADLGLVALSQLHDIAGLTPDTLWAVPEEMHGSIRQDAVLLKRGGENRAALAFMVYLSGAEAAAITARFGYKAE
ncbi:MAG: molybdate ABC transporter substrate-binding protein [Paracoccaceae bacterium]